MLRATSGLFQISIILGMILAFADPAKAGANTDAGCTGSLAALVSRAASEKKSTVIATRCKAWSYKQGTTIAAIAYQVSDFNPEQGGRGIDLVVALVTEANNKIVAFGKIDASEDSGTKFYEGFDNVMVIDTARYELNNGQRAFGVRLNEAAGPQCADGSSGNNLYLFLQQSSGLQQVISGLPLNYGKIIKGEPCGSKPDDVVWDEAKFTLVVMPETSHGLHDLMLITRSSESKRSFSYVLHFDGREYPTTAFSESFNKFWR